MQSQHPKLREIDSKDFQAAYNEIARYYTPVKVRDVIAGTVLPCSLYLPSLTENKSELGLEELLPEGAVYEEHLHSLLTEEQVQELYIKKEKEDAFFNYLNLNIQKIIRSPDVPPEKKTELLYDNAESIVRKVFNERPTPSNIKLGLQFAENFATHITIDTVSVDALFSLFSKDYYTFTHSVQVAILGMSFCKSLGWEYDDVKSFGLGALFHDIGKNAIDEAILNKPSRLDKDEFEIIKKHSVLGYQQMKDAQLISRDQLTVVLHHHEAADGSGYPRGLKGQDIHRFARVAHIVDVYDALTTRRPYKDALPSDKAMRIMNEEMKGSFDPPLFQAFIEFLGMEAMATHPSSGMRMAIELGNQMMIQFDHDATRIRATLVGLEPEEYLILRIPGLLQLQKKIQPGKEIIGRYAHGGIVYGFRANILGHMFHPLRLLFLSYPRVVENINLRKNPRIECFLPAEATIRGKACLGIITDLSEGGCKFLLKQSDVCFLPETIPDEIVGLRVHLIGESRADAVTGKLRSVSVNAAEGKASLGIQFTDLCRESREHIQRYIDNVLNVVQ